MAAKTKEPRAGSEPELDDGLDFTENEAKLSDTSSDGKKKKKKKGKKPKIEGMEVERRGIGKIVAVFIALLLIGGLSALLFFNIFGIRTRYLTPMLRNIPIIGNLVGTEEGGESDPYAGATREELVAMINSLRAQNDELSAANQSLDERNMLFADEITRLQEFEAGQLQFREEKAEFDRMIAMNDPAAYASFYESVSPENADILYEEAAASVQREKDFKKYISTIQAVDAAEAALIMDELIRTDMDLVVLILNNLDSETSGEILANMTTRNAASAMRRMVPAQE